MAVRRTGSEGDNIMKDLDPLVLLAVFEEMLGPLLWLLLAYSYHHIGTLRLMA